MDSLINEVLEILKVSANSMNKYLLNEGINKGAFLDSVNNLIHPRTAAEVALVHLVLWKNTGEEKYLKLAEESLEWVLQQQNLDGSWNEYYVDSPCKDIPYWSNVPTGLITIILCEAYKLLKKKEYRNSAIKAAYFIISVENGKGYFRKGKIQNVDALNTDVICATALANVYAISGEKLFLGVARRGCYHVVKSQHWDGAFPYIWGGVDKNINYQTVTTGFLLMSNKYIKDVFIEKSITLSCRWLRKNFDKQKGNFNWKIDTEQGKETGNPFSFTMFLYIACKQPKNVSYVKSILTLINKKSYQYRGLLPRDIRLDTKPDPYFTANALTPLAYILLENDSNYIRTEKISVVTLLKWYVAKFLLPFRVSMIFFKKIINYL